MTGFHLNDRALEIADDLAARAEELRVVVTTLASGTRLIDCTTGGLEAGVLLAEVCLAGLGRVNLAAGRADVWPGPWVSVATDQPLAACMASQYAGWQITGEKYFAMGSGPMRAAGSREPLFEEIGHRERPQRVVGVLETRKLPPAAVCDKLAADCGVAASGLTLLVAPTASIAGTIQIVARSVETALHKMHEIGFDLAQAVCGYGIAPLPPIACDDLVGIGRTNDAILYAGEVTIWLKGDDAQIAELGPKIPSLSSADYGEPFAAIFERYQRDFYKIDPLLFSPAAVTLVNLGSGVSHRFGETNAAVLQKSFAT